MQNAWVLVLLIQCLHVVHRAFKIMFSAKFCFNKDCKYLWKELQPEVDRKYYMILMKKLSKT